MWLISFYGVFDLLVKWSSSLDFYINGVELVLPNFYKLISFSIVDFCSPLVFLASVLFIVGLNYKYLYVSSNEFFSVSLLSLD